MKTNSIRNIFVLALILFSAFGCSKYEDGPCMSMKSALHRLYGTYQVVYFSKNNVEITQQWKDSCDWTFEFLDDRNTREVEDIFYYEGKFFMNQQQYSMYKFSRFWLVDNNKSITLGLNSYQIEPLGVIGNDSIGIFPFQFGGNRTFRITRLTETELWLKYEDGNDVYEIKMEEF
jgi:hypothetical protein